MPAKARPQPLVEPMEEMSWEERFMAAWVALLKMERRAEDAEREVIRLKGKNP